MTAQHPDILTVRDAEILRRLRRVVEAGAYYRSFTADDVTRVANRWLTPRHAPVVQLHAARQPVALTRKQAQAIRELCDGTAPDNYEIARRLGISRDAVADRLKWAMKAMGVQQRADAIKLVRDKRIQVVIKTEREQAS